MASVEVEWEFNAPKWVDFERIHEEDGTSEDSWFQTHAETDATSDAAQAVEAAALARPSAMRAAVAAENVPLPQELLAPPSPAVPVQRAGAWIGSRSAATPSGSKPAALSVLQSD